MNVAVQEGIIFCEGKGVERGRGGESEGRILELWLLSVMCLTRATPLPGPYVSHQEIEYSHTIHE